MDGVRIAFHTSPLRLSSRDHGGIGNDQMRMGDLHRRNMRHELEVERQKTP
jgi:hypothetical protein